ncbi:MAG TPA: hypothetical protein PKC30_11550 [Saprospiraceae bacterium]|nr:hypothetical protein [Saprospiraceae bacterium]
MKNTLITLILIAIAIPVLAQRTPNNIFRKYKNYDSALYLETKGDFVKFPLLDDGTQRSKVSRIEVIAFGEDQGLKEKDHFEFTESLKKHDYEMLMQVKNPELKADIYVSGDMEYVEEAFGFFHIQGFKIYARLMGKIYLEDLQKMDFNMDGASSIFGILGN